MHAPFVLTIIGPDRRGIVESLSDVIAAHDGNWLESRMARLAGQFAGLLSITLPAERAGDLEHALAELETEGLRIILQAGDRAAPQPAHVLRLELVGHDRPGIVRDIARTLRPQYINVEELTSESYSAPMSGELLFKATLELGIPAESHMDDITRTLDQLAEQLSLDLSYDETPPRQR